MLTVTKLSSGNKLILSTREVEIIQKTGSNPTEIIYTVSIKEQVSENLATILASCGPRELLYVTSSVDPTTQFLIPFHKIKLIQPDGVNDSKIYFNGRSPIIVNEDIVYLANQIALAQNGAQGPQGPQGIPGAISPAGLNWQGAWSATGTYVIDDVVGYNGASYFCINPVGPLATTPDIDTANWALLSLQGSNGAQGPFGPQGIPGPVGPAGLNWQGAWSAISTYVIDDAVGYNGASYFCVNFVGPSAITPDIDTVNWALLAAQGAIGPQGPQGPAGSNIANGNSLYETLSWNGSQWLPTNGFKVNGGQVTIGNPTGITKLNIDQAIPNGMNFGLNLTTAVPNPVQFQIGINPPSANPIFNSSIFLNSVNARLIKFSNPFTRIIIQTNGQVVIGDTIAINTTASLVVTKSDIEVEQIGKGLILASPNGVRWRITVDNAGVISATTV